MSPTYSRLIPQKSPMYSRLIPQKSPTRCCLFPHTKSALSFKSLSTVISHRNAGGRTDFTTGNLNPNLQARFCKLYSADFALFSWQKEITILGLFCGMRRLYVGLFNAGGRTDFAQGKFKPKSASSIVKALSCRFCRLKLSNRSKLVISKKWKSRIALLVHNAWGLFPDRLQRQKPVQCLGAFSR